MNIKGNLIKDYNRRLNKIKKSKKIGNEVNDLVGIKVRIKNEKVKSIVDKMIRTKCIEQLRLESEFN